MRKEIRTASLLIGLLCACSKASAQAEEIQQLLLNVEKLAQFKQILEDMKKGYALLEGGYNTIRDIAEGNFRLHQGFLDGLLQVSPAVRNYRRVAEIIASQAQLVKEYQDAYRRFRRNGLFNAAELAYIGRVYERLLAECLRHLDELALVITAGMARMSDDERLATIDRIYAGMQDKAVFLRQFNNRTIILALQRAKERNDVEALRQLYGTPD